MLIKITSYSKKTNDCQGLIKRGKGTLDYDLDDHHGLPCVIDPFCGLAIPQSREEYEDGKGAECVGKIFEVPDDVLIVGTMVPSENEMRELPESELLALREALEENDAQ